MLSAPSCAMRYISALQYLPEGENSVKNRRLRPREANVESRVAAVSSTEYYTSRRPCRFSRSESSELVNSCLWTTVWSTRSTDVASKISTSTERMRNRRLQPYESYDSPRKPIRALDGDCKQQNSKRLVKYVELMRKEISSSGNGESRKKLDSLAVT